MRTHSKQSGMTFITLALLLVIAGFFALLAMRIGPLYLEHYTIMSVLERLKAQKDLNRYSGAEIHSMIERQLYVNDVHRFELDENRANLKVNKEDGLLKVSAIYEAREHLFFNIDAIVSFSNELELPMDTVNN